MELNEKKKYEKKSEKKIVKKVEKKDVYSHVKPFDSFFQPPYLTKDDGKKGSGKIDETPDAPTAEVDNKTVSAEKKTGEKLKKLGMKVSLGESLKLRYVKLFEDFSDAGYKINIISFEEAKEKAKEKLGIVIFSVRGNLNLVVDEVTNDMFGNHVIASHDPKLIFSEIFTVEGHDSSDLMFIFPTDSVDQSKLDDWCNSFGDAESLEKYFSRV